MDAGDNVHQRTSAGKTVSRLVNVWKILDSERHNALVLNLETHKSAGADTT